MQLPDEERVMMKFRNVEVSKILKNWSIEVQVAQNQVLMARVKEGEEW
jgi:hypothetical protein